MFILQYLTHVYKTSLIIFAADTNYVYAFIHLNLQVNYLCFNSFHLSDVFFSYVNIHFLQSTTRNSSLGNDPKFFTSLRSSKYGFHTFMLLTIYSL